MNEQTITLPGEVAASAAVALKAYPYGFNLWFSLNGAVMTGQLQLAATAAGPWINEGAAFSADAVVAVSKHAKFARVNVTAWTSGLGLATILGPP